jgi:predicted transcriptional regulator
MNYRDFKNYLDFLTSQGILAVEGEAVVITAKGRRLYREILTPFSEMLSDPRLLGKPRWSD